MDDVRVEVGAGETDVEGTVELDIERLSGVLPSRPRFKKLSNDDLLFMRGAGRDWASVPADLGRREVGAEALDACRSRPKNEVPTSSMGDSNACGRDGLRCIKASSLATLASSSV